MIHDLPWEIRKVKGGSFTPIIEEKKIEML